MRKPVSARRQKKVETPLDVASEVQENLNLMDGHLDQKTLSQITTDLQKLSQNIEEFVAEQNAMRNQLAETDSVLSKLQKDSSNVLKEMRLVKGVNQKLLDSVQSFLPQVEKLNVLDQIFFELKQLINTKQTEYRVLHTLALKNKSNLEENHSILNSIVSELKLVKNIGREDYKTILGLLLNKKQEKDTERTISFQLGKVLIDGAKSVEGLVKLPGFLYDLKKENETRKLNKNNTLLVGDVKKNEDIQPVKIENKAITKDTLLSTEILVKKNKISDLNKGFTKALTLLDPISELCWQDGFPGFAISRNKYIEQIDKTTSDFAFFESAWKANKSQWLYAFNSPNLQHRNAQDLLKIIGLLRAKKMPVLFWNKEDPMHYEMFKPIAKEADYVFTTDSLKVAQYKKDLGHENVWALPFAAPIKITNPIGRFELKAESVCFAGTYYAKNHPDRKKQMDMLLPALLDSSGIIYDRASLSNSESYAYPDIYHGLIRAGVDFDEMTKLYKKFKVFLNVNTITQSPTMMSRRVYELLASGTPVISTPSKAITEQFPGIVLTVRNEEEAKLAVNKLLTDSYFWNKQSVLGIREVMSKHTYEDRWTEIKSLMQSSESSDVENVNVRVVAKFHGYQDLEFFIENILAQTVEVAEIVLLVALNKIKDVQAIAEKYKKVHVRLLSDFDVNKYIQGHIDSSTFFTTDSVMLFNNCLKDMLLSYKYHQGFVVSRKAIYQFTKISKNLDLQLPEADWYNYSEEVDLNCTLIKNKFKSKFAINIHKNHLKCINQEKKVFQIDPFNLVTVDRVLINESTVNAQNEFKYVYSARLGI